MDLALLLFRLQMVARRRYERRACARNGGGGASAITPSPASLVETAFSRADASRTAERPRAGAQMPFHCRDRRRSPAVTPRRSPASSLGHSPAVRLGANSLRRMPTYSAAAWARAAPTTGIGRVPLLLTSHERAARILPLVVGRESRSSHAIGERLRDAPYRGGQVTPEGLGRASPAARHPRVDLVALRRVPRHRLDVALDGSARQANRRRSPCSARRKAALNRMGLPRAVVDGRRAESACSRRMVTCEVHQRPRPRSDDLAWSGKGWCGRNAGWSSRGTDARTRLLADYLGRARQRALGCAARGAVAVASGVHLATFYCSSALSVGSRRAELRRIFVTE